MKYKNLIIIAGALVLSTILGLTFQKKAYANDLKEMYEIADTSKSLFPQEVDHVNDKPLEVTKLYREEELVGIIHDKDRLQEMFDEVYEKEYKKDFPDTKLGFIDDLIQVKELTYNIYEDRDDDIFQYIHDEELFAIEVNKIQFSNGYTLYVKDLADFNNAKDSFIKNFISEKAYTAIQKNDEIPDLVDYGSREIDLKVLVSGNKENESVKISRDLASKDEIKMNEAEVITYLSYGPNPKVETYKVKEYDSIEGIAWHNGMMPNQIASINSDQIKDIDQALPVGMELKVSKFNSPFTVRVTKERMTSEPIYPESTIYQSDPELKEGVQVVDVVEKNGARDVLYEDIYENGEEVSSKEKSSKVTLEPVRSVVRYGTKVEPKVGSGRFRYPMNNARMICGYGCYPGHRGVDIAAYGGGYGPIYSVDRGVVVANGYNAGGWGYYIRIDHGNGYQSLYAHMRSPGYQSVGTTVGKGENIGYVGMTGRTTTPHVHLEIWTGGSRINACTVMAC
ncbi:M23 family metallopeptidase [Erysipelothrix urinaevulpis]|uniref:M23 family metallopeptidase n=1 Tax=Erysipelothrix urinaevulpis TaxID=2683717 RepID=UPI0013587325|nr:M23 family metallopeptidase [Erysipelothrix urinaevulpis]